MSESTRQACPLRVQEVCVAVGAGAHLHRFIEWVHAVLLACSVATCSTHLRHREQMRDVHERVRNGGPRGAKRWGAGTPRHIKSAKLHSFDSVCVTARDGSPPLRHGVWLLLSGSARQARGHRLWQWQVAHAMQRVRAATAANGEMRRVSPCCACRNATAATATKDSWPDAMLVGSGGDPIPRPGTVRSYKKWVSIRFQYSLDSPLREPDRAGGAAVLTSRRGPGSSLSPRVVSYRLTAGRQNLA